MDQNSTSCGEGCSCGPTRRDAIKAIGLAVAATLSPRLAMAGPFEASDFDRLVPADKKLSAAWVKSLFDRGSRTVYRGAELKFIGMPVGGLCAGQMYLGGDGKLWHWDIFNQHVGTGAEHYAKPVTPSSPVEQGFALRVTSGGTTQERGLDAKGFADVSFCGEYPIGFVEYADPACPVAVSLEAFSPFIPLNVDDSSLPATVFQFTLKNTGAEKVEVELTGVLENAVGLHSRAAGTRVNRVVRAEKMILLGCGVQAPEEKGEAKGRPPIVFADFEGDDYGAWTAEGEAFGKGPAKGALAPFQHLSGFQGKGLVNTFHGASDKPQGKLTSPEFQVERPFVNFLIGGGRHPKETCINLLVDGKVARSDTGHNSDAMEWASWDVSKLQGKTARLEIVDHRSDGWGHIDIDQIEFADGPRQSTAFKDLPDIGAMGLALLQPTATDSGAAGIDRSVASGAIGEKLVGSLTRKVLIEPGQSHRVTFVVAWRFPNLVIKNIKGGTGRHYATRFDSVTAVAAYVAENYERLYQQTKLWHDTWYDSTLPYWFLDRTHLNASILATSTAMRFANGRFYGWEGVGCCEGTCTHVWQYEQAMGRLFPELDILLRERCDLNPEVGFHADTGVIGHRGEHLGPAVDGQAGTILRAYRDHQMSADDAFLKRNWPNLKKAIGWLIQQDGNGSGILEKAQHNTLDTEWFGPVAWLSGLYLASLAAGKAMAEDVGDAAFAQQCSGILDKGRGLLVETLFNGEYFINKPDPKHLTAINSGSGCEIDQVFGQSWAFQAGLGRVLPERETVAALRSLWRYNFSPDVGPYRKVNKPGRWYAMPGEAGLLMCTFPKPDWNYDNAKGKGPDWAAGYFNECMNGFEYQVAGHMIWEGLVQEGLAVGRAVHDRYHASRRNPWNEVECGDHYARSMASYGLFTAACGYEYHGPKGYLAFAPRLTPDDFKAAFTVAQGWGSYRQKREGNAFGAVVELRWGTLKLRTIGFTLPAGVVGKSVAVSVGDRPVEATSKVDQGKLKISLAAELVLDRNQALVVSIH